MRKLLAWLPAVPFLAALVAGCGGPAGSEAAGGGGSGGSVALVAYSTPKEVYAELISAFKRQGGRDVGFTQSYGASGDQARAVQAGLPADVVALSLEPDVAKLVASGHVAKNWNADEFAGFVSSSVVVFAVRKGNPKNIRTWDDLVRPGVEVLTPNPFTSGGARWNLLAAYGAKLKEGKSSDDALGFVKQLLEHTPVQDKSARESLQTFNGGKGDVLLAYENEAITAQDKGLELDYVIPPATILIENPVAATVKASPAGREFVTWLRGVDAQRIFAGKGYRPVRPELIDAQRFPAPETLFEIDFLGGWEKVGRELFDPEDGKVAAIEKELGVSGG